MLELKDPSPQVVYHVIPEIGLANSANSLKMEISVKKVSKGICNFCHEEKEKLLNCSRCKAVKYCSVDCQRKAWKTHQIACKNAIFIPRDEEIVCNFLDQDGSLIAITQKVFKEKTKATYVHSPLFSDITRNHARTYSRRKKNGDRLEVPSNIALNYEGPVIKNGVKAIQNIKKATSVCRFGGEVFSKDDWEVNLAGRISHKAQSYACSGAEFTFDPSKYTSLGALINDGPPNCELITDFCSQMYPDSLDIPVEKIVMSIKNIGKGENLYIDYGIGHPIKHGIYHLDDQILDKLYKEHASKLDMSCMSITGWVNEVNDEEKYDALKAKSTEIQYILSTPYTLAKLHLNTNLDPLKTLAALKKLAGDIEIHLDNEKIQIMFKQNEDILNFLSKISRKDKQGFSCLLEKISQYSFIRLCYAFTKTTKPPEFNDCQQFCLALDKKKNLYFGTLDGCYWDCSEMEGFEKLFFSRPHQKELFNCSEIESLPKYLKKEFKESCEFFLEDVASKLSLFKQMILIGNKNIYSTPPQK